MATFKVNIEVYRTYVEKYDEYVDICTEEHDLEKDGDGDYNEEEIYEIAEQAVLKRISEGEITADQDLTDEEVTHYSCEMTVEDPEEEEEEEEELIFSD